MLAEHTSAPSRTLPEGMGCPGLFTKDRVGRLICLPPEAPVRFPKCDEPRLRLYFKLFLESEKLLIQPTDVPC